MDGIHDLGGRHGFGPIHHPDDEPVFHSDWEKTVLVMFPAMAMAGAFNLDEFRHGMEQIPPHDYITARYYEHWIDSMIHYGVDRGIFDADDLERRIQYYRDNPDEELPPSSKPEMVETLKGLIASGDDYHRANDEPAKFATGDRVTVVDGPSLGHTRRAGYVRGRTGTIATLHGSYVYPDTNAMGGGEGSEYVYTVEFTGEELWGDEGANTTIYIDLWEPYLLPA